MLLPANPKLAAAAFLLLSLATMAKATPPSHEELQQQLESAAQVVDFAHVSGSESPDTAEIRVPVHARVVVRLSCAGGYRGVLAAAHSGLAAAADAVSSLQNMSSEDAVKLVENAPPMPEGLTAHQAVPYHSSSGAGGMVGGPVPFLSVVETQKPGDYTLVYSIMRLLLIVPHPSRAVAASPPSLLPLCKSWCTIYDSSSAAAADAAAAAAAAVFGACPWSSLGESAAAAQTGNQVFVTIASSNAAEPATRQQQQQQDSSSSECCTHQRISNQLSSSIEAKCLPSPQASVSLLSLLSLREKILLQAALGQSSEKGAADAASPVTAQRAAQRAVSPLAVGCPYGCRASVVAYALHQLFLSNSATALATLTKMTRICALVGFACAVAASYTAAEPLPEEAAVAHLASVSNEEEEGVTVEMEGNDVVISVPTFEGFEVKEVGEDGAERSAEDLLAGDSDDENEGAEKRELHLCYKQKCKKMKYKKGKHYKLKKHYKKGKKCNSYYRPATTAVPMKAAEPAVASVPTKAAAAPVVAFVPSKSYSSTPVSYSAPSYVSSAPSKGYASASLPQVASYQSAPIKATYMPQLASLLPAGSNNGGIVAGSNPSTNYLMQRANSVAAAASVPSYQAVDNTNLLQRFIVQPASYNSSQGQKGQ
ncbi:hypothetical protein Esti_003699 [Eimeria stiedai]